VSGAARNNRYANSQRLMYILRINFRNGRIETLPGLINKTSADPSLILQRCCMSDIKGKFCGYGNHYFSDPYSSDTIIFIFLHR